MTGSRDEPASGGESASAAAGRRLIARRDVLAALAGSAAPLGGWAEAHAAYRGRTLHPGILRIGTYFVNPPFEFVSGGKRIGFEVELMEAIAMRLNLRPVFVNTEWETILRQAQDGLYDCIVGGITITPRRERMLAWSTPYLTTTLSLIVDDARSPDVRSLSDLSHRVVGVQAATTDLDAATAMWKAGQIYSFARLADAVDDLRSGRIGAVMKVRPVAEWFVRASPGLRILAQVPGDPQPLGIGFRLSSIGLVTAVNTAIVQERQDGKFAQLARRWRVS
jgi:ABC-type amino acid transport substrate-binding protein